MGNQSSFGQKALSAAIMLVFIGFLLILANAFSAKIYALFPFLPEYSILVASLLAFVAFGFFLWSRQREFEVQQYEFVNIVTHKFRTPLTYITWSIENLRKEQSPEEKIESIRQIDNAVSRLTEMTDILINMSRIDEGYSYVFKAESLREIVENILKLYYDRIKEKEIQFNIEMGYGLPLISVDVKRMELVIRILLENALRYTPRGGLISIKIELVQNSLIRFSIKDSGIGITRKDLTHIFSKFYRTKEATGTDTEGMGLGLYIAKNIIERHGGEIGAYSPGPNKGSTFTFDLPLGHGK